jgi:hypothetical protein
MPFERFINPIRRVYILPYEQSCCDSSFLGIDRKKREIPFPEIFKPLPVGLESVNQFDSAGLMPICIVIGLKPSAVIIQIQSQRIAPCRRRHTDNPSGRRRP